MAEITGAVRTERAGPVAVVTIAHPPVNAISGEVAAGILEALTAAEADLACRALIVTGDGERYFSAGADLTEFPGAPPGGEAGAAEVTRRLEASRLPVVAAVNGVAYGGRLRDRPGLRPADLFRGCPLRPARDQARDHARLGRHPAAAPAGGPGARSGDAPDR